MDAADVAEYLKENPQFFEDYADVIAEIFVPHPHGGHAIPIAERQIVTLREKNQTLEAKLKELIAYGSENDQISEKVHRSTLALFAAPDLETTLAVLYHSLKEDFGVPQVAARLWGKVPEQSYLPSSPRRLPRSATMPTSSASRTADRPRSLESREWFEDGDALHSFAFLPLRTGADVRRARARQPRSRALPSGHGHALPDAPRRARERRDRALPAA